MSDKSASGLLPKPMVRLTLLANKFDTVRRMQQSATDLLGSKRRQPGPLKPRVVQPQSSVRSIDSAVALNGVRNQYAFRRDDFFRLALEGTPEAGARKNRHVGNEGLAAIKPHLFAFTVSNGRAVVVQALIINGVFFETLGHGLRRATKGIPEP